MRRVNVVILALLLMISMTGCGDDVESAYLLLNDGAVYEDVALQGSVVVPGPEVPVYVEGEPLAEKEQTVTDAPHMQQTGAATVETQQPEVTEYVDIDVLEYFEDTLFIGDSRTAGLRQFGYFETADFFATPGLSVYSIPQTKVEIGDLGKIKLEDLLAQREYTKIYVMLGMNELGYRFPQNVEKYRNFIEDLQDWEPCATLYLCANLHVTSTRSNNDKFFNNENINKMNLEIQTLAEDKELVFLDINELFDDENGDLDKDIASDDSHVTVENYIVWCDWLVEKMEELENAE